MSKLNINDESIDIGEPVKTIPPLSTSHSGKYAGVYAKALELSKGEWLPVTTETQRQALRLRECLKLKGFTVKRRLNTVYISNK